MSMPPWGLYYSSSNNRITSLPLLHVHAAASIKELVAHVKLTHSYANDTDTALAANYSFPIPARAAVCSFLMIKQDGTRVVGQVQETAEARETYESAVAEGKQAALVEQERPDVFSLAVGNIPPREIVRIELIYATVLSEDEANDSVRFHLPTHVGARYGAAPVHHLSTTANFLEIVINVESVAPIAQIGSPSHSISTAFGPDPALPNSHELPFSNYARVSLSSEAALDRDFVLTMKSAGLDAPRCVAEIHPLHPTVALALTLVPRFKLPDLARQEFIFLVDRSGSMRGQRITAARRALVVMLRSFPAQDTLFQIASFGNFCTMLWDDGSRPYNQATLDTATTHVDGMEATYGGTQIREALAHCFLRRKTDRPTSVFLLTDGAAWDVDGVLSEVNAAVASCPPHAFLRVSVLGIGNSASTAMCEGIARVGNGTCMMVTEQETSFTGKIARMLKAARTPLISNITVDWGVPAIESQVDKDEEDDAFVIVSDEGMGTGEGKGKAKMSVSLFDEAVDPLQLDVGSVPPAPEVVLLPPPQVEQSPFKIRTLSPGNRLNVYAILQGKAVPKVVTLTGLTEDGSEIRLSVPVTLSNLPNAPESPPAIHALAARRIIQDVEDGQHALVSSIPDDVDLLARTVRATIVRLGKHYSVASSQTSFVAVDDSGAVSRPVMASLTLGPLYRPTDYVYRGPTTLAAPLPVMHTDDSASKETQYLRRRCFVCQTTEPPSWRRSTLHPGKIVCNKCGLYERTNLRARPLTFSELRRSSSKSPHDVSAAAPAAEPGPETLSDPVEALARLQSFKGCFSPGVLSIVQLKVDVNEARAVLLHVSDVFATILVMAFLRAKLGPSVGRESWEAMYDKARSFAKNALRDAGSLLGVDELEAKAIALLA
ncbi:von Willebrand factor type A domain-containing protein [Mycena galericulata]|nr:von Willebrand factor type A domain-containing protein [Mycena galericulata]